MQFTVATYNIGANEADYRLKLDYLGQDSSQNDVAEMNRAHIAAAKALQDVSVLCLQETHATDRPFLQEFDPNSYAVICHEEAKVHDGMIILDWSKFEEITNLSYTDIMGEHHVVARATLRNGPEVLIATDHIPGFRYANPSQGARMNGHDYAKQLTAHLKQLAEEYGVEHVIVGADMNGHPEIAPDRHGEMAKMGLQTFRSGQSTNVHVGDGEQHNTRELDFIFAKGFTELGTAVPEAFAEWADPIQGSDHRPIVSTFEYEPKTTNYKRVVLGALAAAMLIAALGVGAKWFRGGLINS